MSKTTCPMNHKAGVAPLNCPACHGSGFVTDSGTGEEPVYNMDEVDLCAKCGTMKHLNQYGVCGRCYPTLPVMDSAPQPSEAEGKPVPAPATPLPADDKCPKCKKPLSESELDLSEESEQAQLLQEAYQLGFHDVRDGKLKPVLDKLNALIDRREAAHE